MNAEGGPSLAAPGEQLSQRGFFHIDIAEVRTEQGKLYLFAAIDRTPKFAFVQLVERANACAACGIQFADLQNRSGPTAMLRGHPFDRVCQTQGIEHRLTKPNHPWTNGQVERTNRTIKEATVKRYHYESHDRLRSHPDDFVRAYNCGRRLKTLMGPTPFEFICKIWTPEPERFILDPLHQMPGLNI